MDGTWGPRSGKSFCAEGEGKRAVERVEPSAKIRGVGFINDINHLRTRCGSPLGRSAWRETGDSLPVGATLGIGGTTFNVVADTSKSPKTLDITEPRQGARCLMIAFDDRADRSAVRLGTPAWGRRCQLHDDFHEVGKNSLYPREQTVSFEHEHNKYSVRNQIAAVECFHGPNHRVAQEIQMVDEKNCQ